jgi:hypothetical protein
LGNRVVGGGGDTAGFLNLDRYMKTT